MLFTTNPKPERSFLSDSTRDIAIRFKDWYMKHPGLTLYNKETSPWVKKTDDELWEEFLKHDENARRLS
jgi:hypothetical protein